MPPLLLISSTASCEPCSFGMPMKARSPDTSSSRPTFNGGSAARATVIAAAVPSMAPSKTIPNLRPELIVISPVSESDWMSWLEVILQDRCSHRVFRVDHVAEAHPPGLAEQHVGVDLVEAVVGRHPAHELAIGDTRRVLERTRAADRHDEVLCLEPRPGEAPVLDQVD